ncbi:MAG TPA: DUF402 domain-containing protein [Pyrinomonadaceae bacterium]|jgi:hypothetical protein
MSETVETIIVRACKYDGTEHKRWQARLLSREDSLLLLDACFDEEIRHALLGVIERGTLSMEYYWLDRWYNVFRFHEPTGELRNYYCNINVPPTFDGRVLSYVDLDIDILVAPDLSYRIVDEDEFALNAARFDYPSEVHARAADALAELLTLIESRRFPFDYQD